MAVVRTLSKDVRLLGDLLGETLRAHGGEGLFEQVEAMRKAAKTARDAGQDRRREGARRRLIELSDGMQPDEASEVVRAFTLYFQLINLAEDLDQTREKRLRTAGGEQVEGSLDAALHALGERGATRAEVTELLSRAQITFVFTAHPTEARRRTTERLLLEAKRALVELDRRRMVPQEEQALHRRLRATIEALWGHAVEREARPQVLDEVKAGLWYLENILLDELPRLHRRLVRALREVWGDWDPLEVPLPLRFGSWMGSDRDGNPFVNDGVTERTLELQRRVILGRYLDDLRALADQLAVNAARLPPCAALDEALERAEAEVPEITAQARARNPEEPLRRLLTFMSARISRSLRFEAGAYHEPSRFLDDLLAVRAALLGARAEGLADDRLLDLIQRVRGFGFVLARLDVREDSRVHRAVIAELLGEPDYPSWPAPRRVAALAGLRRPGKGQVLSPAARRLTGLFESIGRMQTRFGDESLGTYIVSMCESHADILEVVRLARLYRLDRTLDFVPLLETPEALDKAGEILGALLGNGPYRGHLEQREETQELLLGYSDSMKQSGILASRVKVLQAQVEAAEICARAGVRIRVFHGRGGSVSRGGGPTDRALRALPRRHFSGEVKITEQGETRAYHFADHDLAVRYLEQTLGAGLSVAWEADQGLEVGEGVDEALLERLSATSFQAYRDLVETPGFFDYFHQATPAAEIAGLNIGSRPSKRGRGAGLDDLRAIPWVFSWAQSRQVLTGWYGVGSALEAEAERPGGVQALRALYKASPFFRDLLDNVQMTLVKADPHIARLYAELCDDPALREQIHGQLSTELARTTDRLLEVLGHEALLEDDRRLQRSIQLRNPYVDPLSYLQVRALRALRAEVAEGAERREWERVAREAVKGVAAGLRNTG